MTGLGAGRWITRIAPLLLFVLCAVTAGPAEARRVALVIGNSAYASVSALENPKNDAAALAEALRSIGFDEVREEIDLDHTALRRALRDFTALASGAETAVIYYAGHGVEVDGRNYLVPIDATLAEATDTEFEAIPLDSARTAVSGASSLRLVILDACRNNPFKLASATGTRSVGRGLARVEPGANEMVAYAAREGTVASDGTGANSPYASALVKHLKRPGLDVRLLFGEVRDEVMAATANKQEPFTYGTLGGQPIFLSAPKEVAATESAPTVEPESAATGAPSKDKQAAEAWIAVKDTTSVGVLKTYIARFEGTVFADLAAARLAEIEAAAAPAAESPPTNEVAAATPDEGQDEVGAPADAVPNDPEIVTLEPQVFPVGKWAEGFAFDGEKFWVAESGQRTLAIVEPSGQVTSRIPVGRLPVGVEASATGEIYSLQHTDKTLWTKGRRDRKGKVLARLQECPQDLAVTDRAVWVLTWPDCSSGNARAIRIDKRSGKQGPTELLGEWGETITAAHGSIWVGHVRGNRVSRVDPASLALSDVATGDVDVWDLASNAGFVFAGGRVNEDNAQGVVLAIAPQTLEIVSRQQVGQMVQRVVANDDHVVAIGIEGRIWVMAADTLILQREITLSVGTFRPSDALFAGNQLVIVAQQLGGESGALLVVNDWQPSPAAVSGD